MKTKHLLLYFLLLLAIIATGSCKPGQATLADGTGFFRSQDFHNRFKLTEVVVFSRHNIRAPLAAPGSFISRITPQSWHDFGVNASQLTVKGGELETINGQFFHKWLVREGLIPKGGTLSDDEIYVLANSKQRTLATAQFFLDGFMPDSDIPVNHQGQFDEMDPTFTLALGSDITESQWDRIIAETVKAYDAEDIMKASQALQANYDLISYVLDVKQSQAYKDGSFKGFVNHNSEVVYKVGAEPAMTASFNDAGSVADALILQYYEEPDLDKVAFGKNLTIEQWQMFSRIIEKRDAIRFSSSFVQHYVSQHQRALIAEELLKDGRKFTYICGHDTNILNILKAMQVIKYDIPDAIEVSTPIGSKIVFEKWVDNNDNVFVGVSHVYQTLDQLRGNIPLDLNTTPNCIHLSFEGMQANEDGLYPIDMMIHRLTDQVD